MNVFSLIKRPAGTTLAHCIRAENKSSEGFQPFPGYARDISLGSPCPPGLDLRLVWDQRTKHISASVFCLLSCRCTEFLCNGCHKEVHMASVRSLFHLQWHHTTVCPKVSVTTNIKHYTLFVPRPHWIFPKEPLQYTTTRLRANCSQEGGGEEIFL